MTIPDIYGEVLDKANIIEVLDHYGINVQNGKAICPFHSDTNPSMVVTLEKGKKKNVFHCFPCEAGGNVVTFVKKYETEINNNNISTNDALIKIAEICNLDIDLSMLKKKKYDYQYTTTARKYTKEEKSLIEANSFLNDLFSYILTATAVGRKPLEYLHERGLTDEMIKDMSIGYIPKGQILRLSESQNAKVKQDQLKALGMIKLGDKGYYETFVDRIMFPITDEKGNVITFAGRTITDETPKYLHTSETPIFHKKDLLYNYADAKNYSYNNEIYLVEGYMDVVGAKKLGINNVAALMGTSLSDEHLKLLKKNNSTLILALDNDYKNENNVGREAMLRRIPDLLKEGFKVEVLDISKIGEYKDFGELSENNISLNEINKSKVSAFEFMMEYFYFKDKSMNVSNIYDAFEKAKKDKFITSTLDESLYKEYILNETSFSKEELEEILYPKNISVKTNPVSNYQSIVMDDRIKSELVEYLEKRNDKVISGYYELNKDRLNKISLDLFHSNPSKYLSKNAMKLNPALLLQDALKQDDKYSEYETLHRFKYEDLFEKTFVKSISGSARVELTFEQKQSIIKQYEDGLSDKDKLALEEVEELYIINDTKELNSILNIDNDIMKRFKEDIQDRMFLNQNSMDFFKYGHLFPKINPEFISSEFKGKTGNYKTILFFNNLSNSIQLSREQLIKEESNEITVIKNLEIEKNDIDENKDYVFSINKMLLSPTYETDTHYFIRIPNTGAKDYFYLSKDECNWSDNKEMLFTKFKSGVKYKIYDKFGEFKCEKTTEKLKHYWEDKTNKNNNSVFESKVDKEDTETIGKDSKKKEQQPYIPQKQPVCKVFKTRIKDETDKGYYFKTNDRSTLLYVPKDMCKYNEDNSLIIIYPKNSFLFGTGISKYRFDGENKIYEKNLSFTELKEYLSIFYPASYKKGKKEIIKVAKTSCKFNNNFVNITITLENIFGYISVNKIKCKTEEDNIILELSKNEQLSFYTSEGNYIGNYGVSDIRNGLKGLENKVIPFRNNNIDFASLMNSYKKTSYSNGEDKIEFIPTTIEPTYKNYETVMQVKLNDNYIYKPEGKSIAPCENKLFQEGIFKNPGDVVAFLNTYCSGKNFKEVKEQIFIEREVA